MDREEWLATVLARQVERYDTVYAPSYDDDWGALRRTHAKFVEHVVQAVPEGGVILDAACGTGRLFPTILAAGRRASGVDASAGMLAVAERKHPGVPLERRRLEDLADTNAYGAVICVDALENLPPEHWPTVLANLRRAAKPRGLVYLTVEVPDPEKLRRSTEAARARGWPVVDGEDAVEDGYHYYPPRERVLGWLDEAALDLVEQRDGDDYWHLLCRVRPVAAPAREREGASVRALVTGAVVAVAVGVGILLVAGSFGMAGVVGAAVLEAALIALLYRWSPSH